MLYADNIPEDCTILICALLLEVNKFKTDWSKYSAIIEGLNLSTKHIKPSADNPKGGIEKKESPIHLSNLMLVDPSNGKPTKIFRKRNKDGKIERYSKKTNKRI